MLIRFHCSGCKTPLEIEAGSVGTRISCPACQNEVLVPCKGLEEGTTVGNFRIERLIGRGGMGEVYLARQLSMDRPVALKVLPSSLTRHKDFVERFFHEVKITARLEHAHLVTAYEAGEDSGVLYLAMAYVAGHSLYEHIKKQHRLAEHDALDIVIKVARALAYAWNEHRLLHRDIKPANILIDSHGEPKLTDMGLAKSLAEKKTEELTVAGSILGTPNYMSPEQAEADDRIDCRADMYSLGATLYHMLTGKVPFDGSSVMDTLRRQASELLPDPRESVPSITPACVQLLEIMLARDPKRRHRTWEALVEDLERVRSGYTPAYDVLPPGESVMNRRADLVTAVPPPEPAETRSQTNLLVALVVVAALGTVAAIAYRMKMSRGESSAGDGLAAAVSTAPDGAAAVITALSNEAPGRTPQVDLKGMPRVPPEFEARIEQVRKRMGEAREHAVQHPEDVGTAVHMLRALEKDARGTPIEGRLAKFIGDLEVLARENRERALGALRDETARLLKRHRFDDALSMLEKYPGPYMEETKILRAQLAEQTRKEKSDYLERESGRQIERLMVDVAGDLLAVKPATARERIEKARADAVLKKRSAELDSTAKLLDCASRMDELLLASVRNDLGNEIKITLRDGRVETVMPLAVSSNGISARRLLPQGYIEMQFDWADLSPAEKYKRLGSESTPEALFMGGIIALEAGNLALAEQKFKAVGAPLADALASAVAKNLQPAP